MEGRLVRLRAREPGDAESVYDQINDPEVTRTLALRYPLSHADNARFIDEHSTVSYHNIDFAIERRDTGARIGGCGFHRTVAEARFGDLGIAISDRSAWGQGFATDAVRTLCRFGFDDMNLHRIGLSVYSNNAAAQHVYEKVGFVVEYLAREAVFKNGEWLGVTGMGLLTGELRDEDAGR